MRRLRGQGGAGRGPTTAALSLAFGTASLTAGARQRARPRMPRYSPRLARRLSVSHLMHDAPLDGTRAGERPHPVLSVMRNDAAKSLPRACGWGAVARFVLVPPQAARGGASRHAPPLLRSGRFRVPRRFRQGDNQISSWPSLKLGHSFYPSP